LQWGLGRLCPPSSPSPFSHYQGEGEQVPVESRLRPLSHVGEGLGRGVQSVTREICIGVYSSMHTDQQYDEGSLR